MNIKHYEINTDKQIQEKYREYLSYKMSYIYKALNRHKEGKQFNILQKQLKSYHNKMALLEKSLIHKDFLNMINYKSV